MIPKQRSGNKKFQNFDLTGINKLDFIGLLCSLKFGNRVKYDIRWYLEGANRRLQ